MFLLSLVVNMLGYHFPLTVYLQLFAAGLKVKLKIVHKLENSNVYSNCCCGVLKLWYGFLFHKFTLDIIKQKSTTFETFFSSRINEICSLVGFFSSFLAILVRFEIANCIVTMATHNLRLLFFEILWPEVLTNAFRANSEKSWKWLWYTLSENWS